MAVITDNEAFHRSAKFPLLKECDMEADVKDEAADICVAAAEKYKDNFEKAAQVIGCSAQGFCSAMLICVLMFVLAQVVKDALDKKFGGRWHVVIGTEFAHRVTHEVRARKARTSTITKLTWGVRSICERLRASAVQDSAATEEGGLRAV